LKSSSLAEKKEKNWLIKKRKKVANEKKELRYYHSLQPRTVKIAKTFRCFIAMNKLTVHVYHFDAIHGADEM